MRGSVLARVSKARGGHAPYCSSHGGEAMHTIYGRCSSWKYKAVLQILSNEARQRARAAATYRSAACWRACCGCMSKPGIVVSRLGGDKARLRRMLPCRGSNCNCPEEMSGEVQRHASGALCHTRLFAHLCADSVRSWCTATRRSWEQK
jgi:hypothetical protein